MRGGGHVTRIKLVNVSPLSNKTMLPVEDLVRYFTAERLIIISQRGRYAKKCRHPALKLDDHQGQLARRGREKHFDHFVC